MEIEVSAGTTEFFLKVVLSLEEEELIKRSPRGQKLGIMLKFVQSMETKDISDIAAHLMSLANKCILAGKRHKLPSAAHAAIWSTFHCVRGGKQLQDPWDSFVSTHIPVAYQQEPKLFLQLIIDRMLKQIIKEKAEEGKLKQAAAVSLAHLTVLQSNGIRYMAGYIAIKLLKKYRKTSKNHKVQLKRKLFVRVY